MRPPRGTTYRHAFSLEPYAVYNVSSFCIGAGSFASTKSSLRRLQDPTNAVHPQSNSTPRLNIAPGAPGQVGQYHSHLEIASNASGQCLAM